MQVEVDFARYPAAKFGTARFDVPLREPLGRLKKALRSMLHRFPEVEGAYLLLYSDPALGDKPRLIVSVVPRVDTRPLYSAWEPHISEFGPVGFFGGIENRFSAFVAHAAAPFYRGKRTLELPPLLSKTDLIHNIRALPDEPVLAQTAAHLETLKENYDHLPPGQAEAEYRAQQMEMEQALQALRSKSTHPKAKTALLNYLTVNGPFGLVLRTFSTETTTGRSPFGEFRRWMLTSPMGALLSKFSPFPLVGIANPHNPFPLADIPFLECSDDWLLVVRSIIAIAARIYFVCDRFSPGVANEFCAIQTAEREDDTFIILPGHDQNEYYRDLYSLAIQLDDPGPFHTEILRRRLATYGHIITTDELDRSDQGRPPFNNGESAQRSLSER